MKWLDTGNTSSSAKPQRKSARKPGNNSTGDRAQVKRNGVKSLPPASKKVCGEELPTTKTPAPRQPAVMPKDIARYESLFVLDDISRTTI